MGRSRVEFDEVYERRDESRARSRPPVREYEDIRFSEERSGPDPTRQPYFMRDGGRPTDSGQLVIRSRDFEERRGREVSPPEEVKTREMRIVRARSEAPDPPPSRRMVEAYRERDHSEIRARYERDSSESPPRVRTTRVVEARRERSMSRSPSRERIRIVEKRVTPAPAPAPAPPPPPPKEINEPTIRRKVITDYVAFDHGVIPVAPPPPPPPPPQQRVERKETEIDVYTRRGETEVDIRRSKSQTRTRSRSVERASAAPAPGRRNEFRELVVRSSEDREKLTVDYEETKKRRARSAHPPSLDIDDEAAYITSRIDSRGRMGEAYNGITRDWTMIDVPPGTERVRMEGAGGAAAEVSWQKYSGVRRAKFMTPDEPEPQPQPQPKRSKSRDRLSVQIYDNMGKEGMDVVEDRRISIRHQNQTPPPPTPKQQRSEMWTEITKDLVIREAVEEMGYEFEETEHFYYVMQFLRYEDVQQLVQISDGIKRARKHRAREIEWEVDIRSSEFERREQRPERAERPRRQRRRSVDRFEVDTEVTYDHRRY